MSKLGALIFCRTSASEAPCNNLLEIIGSICTDPQVILVRNVLTKHPDGFTDFCDTITYTPTKNLFRQAVNYCLIQIKIIRKIINVLSSPVSVWCIFMGETSIIPVLFLKILRKRVILILPGSLSQELEHDPKRMQVFLKAFSSIVMAVSNNIIIYSPNLVKEWHLEKYKHKIICAHRHIVDFDHFRCTIPFEEREDLVGFVGQFNSRKGILNIVNAIPSILHQNSGVKFIFCGDGPLFHAVLRQVEDMQIDDRVKLPGWVDHQVLPEYLNTLKLLILPSHAEGLPNIMLEAMACGTPVLVTSVGSIPDVISHNINGYILPDNSPASIAKSILCTLNDPNLHTVAMRGHSFVRGEYTLEKNIARWKKVFQAFEDSD